MLAEGAFLNLFPKNILENKRKRFSEYRPARMALEAAISATDPDEFLKLRKEQGMYSLLIGGGIAISAVPGTYHLIEHFGLLSNLPWPW